MENTNLMHCCHFISHEYRGNSRTIDSLSNSGRVKKERLVT